MTRSLFPARMSVGMFAMLLSVSGAPLSAQADAGSVVHFGVIGSVPANVVNDFRYRT